MIEVLQTVLSPEISAYPHLWSVENPTVGCCIPVALVVQDIYGGDLARVSLAETPFRKMRYHWFNILTNGEKIDKTVGQFGTYNLDTTGLQKMERKKALSIRGVRESYQLLKERMNQLR